MAALAAVLVVAAAGAGAFLLLRDADDEHSPSKRFQFDPAAADVAARRACQSFGRFEDLVERNASSKDVFAALDEAKAQAELAAEANPRWRSLAGGTDALRLGFKEDDAGATRAGVDVVRGQCALTR